MEYNLLHSSPYMILNHGLSNLESRIVIKEKCFEEKKKTVKGKKTRLWKRLTYGEYWLWIDATQYDAMIRYCQKIKWWWNLMVWCQWGSRGITD